MKRISIDPITRLEGHGKIDIFLDEQGDVANCYLQIPELRGFEKFCEGDRSRRCRTSRERICGVCPEAHHMAATKALGRRLSCRSAAGGQEAARIVLQHLLRHGPHHALLRTGRTRLRGGSPSPPAERNLIGVINKVGMDIAGKVLKMRRDGHKLIKMMGGRAVHPNWGLPGGVSCGLNDEKREEIERLGRDAIEFAKFSLKLFHDVVLANAEYVDLIKSDMYTHRPTTWGPWTRNNHVNFYDGKIRVVGPDGEEKFKYDAQDYRDYVAERVEPWSYLKFPYLKKVGWKGFVDGVDSGVYRATPLSRLNAADGMATPAGAERIQTVLRHAGGKPVQPTLATHWARLIELLYATENWVRLATEPDITSERVPCAADRNADRRGWLCRGAARTLTHHYATDERGIVTQGELDRRNHQQQCADLHVGQEGGPRPDQERQGQGGVAEHG